MVAIVALFAVAAGLAAYAGVLGTVPESEHEIAEPTLQRAYATLAPAGIVEPERLTADAVGGPSEYDVRIAVEAGGEVWHVGPETPPRSDVAMRPVTVRVAPGVNRPGQLSVAVWR